MNTLTIRNERIKGRVSRNLFSRYAQSKTIGKLIIKSLGVRKPKGFKQDNQTSAKVTTSSKYDGRILIIVKTT